MRKPLAILMTLPPFKAAVADLHAFATASLTDALKEIAPGFEKESGIHATLNPGGSSLLRWQIEKSASTDVFVSAEAKMDELQKNGFIVATDKADFVFAYKTEGAIPKRMRLIYAVPEKETPKIRWPVAILREIKRHAAVERFPRYFGSSDALDFFGRCGFDVHR